MLTRLQQMCDSESYGVWFAAVASAGLSLAAINAALTTVVLLGTAIYTWRRALRRRPPGEGDER
ncbi:MAG: hypothetical protein KGL39_21300 [Patescibacteria group bacterium]|nr:hypothetical protein [Patescibacteria group bacterium]